MRSNIVLSVLETSVEAAAHSLRDGAGQCGLVEIRADLLPASSLREAVAAAPAPVIVTVRKAESGGEFRGVESERFALLRAGLDAGARYVDVEYGSDPARSFLESDPDRVILSSHGEPCTFDRLRAVCEGMSETPAALLKIVPTAERLADLRAIRDLLAVAGKAGRGLACFAQGGAGALSRLLAPSWGSWATYAATRAGAETAPGQFTAGELSETYDVLGIGAGTRTFALIGRHLGYSPSPAIHMSGYREQGLDARYFPLEPASVDDLVAATGEGGILEPEAFGVTIPFKEEIAVRSRPGDRWSGLSGAVNTVRISGGGWTGFNTDASAADRLVRRSLDPRGSRAVVVGAGGTARAMTAVLREGGAVVTVVNRTPERAERVAAAMGAEWAGWDRLHELDAEVLVQTTPLGREGESFLEPPRSCRLVIDAAYGGATTPLAKAAARAGCAVVDGPRLLLEQALDQYRIMTGREPPRAVMRDAARSLLPAPPGA